MVANLYGDHEMNSKFSVMTPGFALLLALGVSSCSSFGHKSEEGKDLAASGPTVTNSRINPGTIVLDRKFRANQPAEILAEVKDFGSKINHVSFRLNEVPLEIELRNVAGSTYRAEINPEQLKKLAVGNQTTTYTGTIVAKNAKGQVATSSSLPLAIQAPDLSDSG
jgi:hypothetical protein